MKHEQVRIGLIGLGQRGLATLQRYAVIQQARIAAIADISSEAVGRALRQLETDGRPTPQAFVGEDGWRQLCQSEMVDIVFICTDWASHTPIALYAMRQGHHVAIEVPAATNVTECWQLVETAHETQRRCTMLENCCYDTFHLGLLPMARRGLFGALTHVEGAYIHDLRTDHGWMSYTVSDHAGNPYPTHGLGPACQLLDVHHGDRLTSLVSLSGLNKVNNTLLHTHLGRTILLQFDERTPRPYSRLQTLCGTAGFAQKYPLPTIQFDGERPLTDEEATRHVESYWDDDTRQLVMEGRGLGVPNLMNYVMDRRLVRNFLTDQPFDISVFDAALWSCVAELSARSAAQGGTPVEIPDFTQGQWT